MGNIPSMKLHCLVAIPIGMESDHDILSRYKGIIGEKNQRRTGATLKCDS